MTQAHNLPISLAFTRFLQDQLDDFSTKLAQESESNTPSAPMEDLPGTDMLPTVIDHLLPVITLKNEEKQTREHFRQVFEGIGNSTVDRFTEEIIKKGIIDGGNKVFSFLNKSIQSGELFAKALQQSLNIFSTNTQDVDALTRLYTKNKNELFDTASKTFQRFIHKTVHEKVDEYTTIGRVANVDTARERSFIDQQIIAITTIDKLTELLPASVDSEEDNTNNSLYVDCFDGKFSFEVLSPIDELIPDKLLELEGKEMDLNQDKNQIKDIMKETILTVLQYAIQTGSIYVV